MTFNETLPCPCHFCIKFAELQFKHLSCYTHDILVLKPLPADAGEWHDIFTHPQFDAPWSPEWWGKKARQHSPKTDLTFSAVLLNPSQVWEMYFFTVICYCSQTCLIFTVNIKCMFRYVSDILACSFPNSNFWVKYSLKYTCAISALIYVLSCQQIPRAMIRKKQPKDPIFTRSH